MVNLNAMLFITLLTGSDGRHEVSINVEEIASYENHTVTSYSYQEWTIVTLKNGVRHDCYIKKSDLEKKLKVAFEAAL